MARLVLAALVVALLVPAATAQADEGVTRIYGGQPAAEHEYPAQGYLQLSTAFLCGGTLVGRRAFLTAAHCVVNEATGMVYDPTKVPLRVTLDDATPAVSDAAHRYGVVAINVDAAYDPVAISNDVALLTLDREPPVPRTPLVQPDEPSLWQPGVFGRIIGWGTTETSPFPSDTLLKADVPIVADAACSRAYGLDYDPGTMLCAGDGVHDTCSGDSGGPLLVADAAGGFVEAGVTSWGGSTCADPQRPGVYVRLGAPTLNDWVRSRIDNVSFSATAAVEDRPVTLTASARHPEAPGTFTAFAWDLDGDGAYDDATGPTVTHVYPNPGRVGVGVQASDATGRTAAARGVVDVAAVPVPSPTAAPASPPASPPAAPVPRRISVTVSKAFRVRHGRTRVRRLALRGVPADATVTVTCTRKRCAFTRRTARGAGTVSLTKLFRGRTLRRGTVIELRVTAPDAIGAVVRFITRRHAPRRIDLCLAPGAARPTRCG